ncbi:MAG: S-adenosylmethionine decarboxylase [Bacteroidota bacterium]
MKNLAPNIFRKRLMVEGYFSIDVDETTIRTFFSTLTGKLQLATYGDPIIHHTSGVGKDENQGYDAFVPLIDSGIYLAVWSNQRFFSMIIYTCKDFNDQLAVEATQAFFNAGEVAFKAF